MITALPTKVVLLYKAESEDPILVPDWARRKGEEVRGHPPEWRPAVVVSSGRAVQRVWGVCDGDTVAMRMSSPGLTLEHRDLPEEIPAGSELRIIDVFDTVAIEETDPILFKVAA